QCPVRGHRRRQESARARCGGDRGLATISRDRRVRRGVLPPRATGAAAHVIGVRSATVSGPSPLPPRASPLAKEGGPLMAEENDAACEAAHAFDRMSRCIGDHEMAQGVALWVNEADSIEQLSVRFCIGQKAWGLLYPASCPPREAPQRPLRKPVDSLARASGRWGLLMSQNVPAESLGVAREPHSRHVRFTPKSRHPVT